MADEPNELKYSSEETLRLIEDTKKKKDKEFLDWLLTFKKTNVLSWYKNIALKVLELEERIKIREEKCH